VKILHFSESSLPDWRIEKAALTGLKNGHEVFFCGSNSDKYKRDFTIFSRIYNLTWTNYGMRGLPYYWHQVKKQFNKIIQEVKPDIIHAHNVMSAKMASEFKMSIVFDDHEYWDNYSKIRSENYDNGSSDDKKLTTKLTLRRIIRETSRDFLIKYSNKLWVNWEKELVMLHPTITVSIQIAEELKKVGNTSNVFVVPNFPLQKEIVDITNPQKHNKLSCVYAGIDKQRKKSLTFRDFSGLTDLFNSPDIATELYFIGINGQSTTNVKYIDFLDRNDMFQEMSKHSIGLVPWKKHWSHSYLNPNKYSEYAHAGLYVLCTSSLKTISDTLQDNCMNFEDYDDLVSKLNYFQNHLDELYEKRLKIFKFARKNLLWENYEQNILNAYKLA
jgi:glycosyltransferase involved in cell wall biosynthesis